MTEEVYLIHEGYFSLDSGAIFGTIPEPLWSRSVKRNSKGRIDSHANVIAINNSGKLTLIDSGVGNVEDAKFRDIFQISTALDLRQRINEVFRIENLHQIIHTHLHFDHCGNDANLIEGNSARIVLQKKEHANYLHPNLFTRGSYVKKSVPGSRVRKIDGSLKMGNSINIIATGGHTTGHQVVEFTVNGRKYIHFGDLIPSTFHIKPNFIPAIDTNPLDTLKFKLKLIKKAIDEKAVCIFNHDPFTPAGTLSGDELRPTLTPFDIARV